MLRVLPALATVAISCQPVPDAPADPVSQAELASLQYDPGLNSLAGQMDAVRKHLDGSPGKKPTARDSARARDLVTRIRAALQKYQDVDVARAEGFLEFGQASEGGEVHLNRYLPLSRTLEVEKPQAVLYHRDSAGGMRLIGAMYNVVGTATEGDLEKLAPLSIVSWHRHVNWCIPPLDQQQRWTEKRNGRYVFGHTGITDRKDCESVGGLFRDDLAGWMTHAYVFASDDLGVIWGGAQMGGALVQEGHAH